MTLAQSIAALAASVACAAPLAQAAAQASPPTFAELEAVGATIGRILVRPQNIFNDEDLADSKFLFQLANRLHAVTRPETIRSQLLFKPGDYVSVRVIDETERLLRANRYLQDVQIRPLEYRDGVVDIEVATRDSWTLDPGISVARAGGENSSRMYLRERNLLGSGMAVGLSYSNNVDRAGTEVSISDNNLFGSRLAFAGAYGFLTDGSTWSLALAQPFYSLDTRQAAGFSISHNDVSSPIYEQGVKVSQYRTLSSAWDAWAGWSPGRTGSWTRRYAAGMSYSSALYSADPLSLAPAQIPEDLTLSGPYLRFEAIEDAHEKVSNREQIGRAEFFSMGWQTKVQLGRSMTSFGSTENSWLYSAGASKGFGSAYSQALLLTASVSGRALQGTRHNQLLSGSARYYWPQGSRTLFSASLSGDVYRHPDIPAPLQIGGDNGLRGYPLNYQSGERRALLTLEERVYTDWYPFRLLRVGGAAFLDAGRAWHGVNQISAGERVLTDWGFGLRLADSRSAMGSVLHADIAFPLNARDQVRSVQFILKSHTSF